MADIDASDEGFPRLRVAVIGAGPVGLTFAICLAEFAAELKKAAAVQVVVYELRMSMCGADEVKYSGRRRSQVVTLQDHVVDCFKHMRGLHKCFNFDRHGCEWERVWKTSRNIPVSDLEDLLLAQAKAIQKQHGNLKVQVLPEHLKEGQRGRGQGGPWRGHDGRLTDEGRKQWRRWVESLDVHVIIAADGAGSMTRESYNDIFGRVLLGAEEGTVTTDYSLGLGLDSSAADTLQPQRYNTAITLGQNRFLLNSLGGGARGYLNIRLTKAEFDEFQEVTQNKCTFGSPCAIWPRSTRDTLVPNLQVLLRSNMGILDTYIHDGLQLFGLQEQNVQTVECFELTPAYVKRFWCPLESGQLLLLIGDSAITHHFWPGRGMNTGLKAAFMAACCIWAECEGGHLGKAAPRHSPSRTWRTGSSFVPPAAVHPMLTEFSRFMKALREREMQHRSLSMLQPEAALPAFLDEIVRAGEGLVGCDRLKAQVRKYEEIHNQLHPAELAAELEEKTNALAERFASWQAVTPFRNEPDIGPELKSHDKRYNSPLRRSTRPSLACTRLLYEAACENPPGGGRPGRQGWPLRWQRGKEVEPKDFAAVPDPLQMLPRTALEEAAGGRCTARSVESVGATDGSSLVHSDSLEETVAI